MDRGHQVNAGVASNSNPNVTIAVWVGDVRIPLYSLARIVANSWVAASYSII